MKKEVVVECHECRDKSLYKVSDLLSENDPDDPDFYVNCKECSRSTGSPEELQPLIDQLPDYEPNEDETHEEHLLGSCYHCKMD